MHLFSSMLLSCLLLSSITFAQGTLADFKRADSLREAFKNKVYYSPQRFHWQDKSTLWYSNQTAEGTEYMLVDVLEKKKEKAFDHEKLAATLSQESNSEVKSFALEIKDLKFSKEENSFSFEWKDSTWIIGKGNYEVLKKEVIQKNERDWGYWGNSRDELGNDPIKSPDGVWEASVKEYNMYLRNIETKEEFQLSFDGAAGEYYSSYLTWSPDSKKIATYKFRPNTKHFIYFVDSSPDDQVQPKLETREYLKPGDALPVKTPSLFLVEEKKQIQVDNSLITNQFSLSRINWKKDSQNFTFEYNQRGHQLYRILEVNASSGAIRTLVEETSKTFIDYGAKMMRHYTEDGKEIIWSSERDGWNHFYLYDVATGTVKNQITKGEWVVRELTYVDEKNREIIFQASGMKKGMDPYFTQYYRINFDGTGLQKLTSEDGNHAATFSEDHQYFVDTYSKVDEAQITLLRSAADGKVIMELEKGDISALEAAGWKKPDVFTAKGRDGKTDIWGIIIRPSTYDPKKSYPIIEYIYAGPHSSFVPKSFSGNYRYLHDLAELGFIVVSIDGMGTSNRSKAFHDVCWKNLKDSGFPDRITWMKAAAKKYPYMDIDRVGLFGGSAGGQSTVAGLLFHPEFYKVGSSSCGCHDNRMDKIWWNEQWMGYPIGKHYEECSNVVNAGKLEGKLLLILGEMDDNVDPSSTLQLVDALIKENKDFDFVMLPGVNHTLGGDFGMKKRRDFFVKHLFGVDPPSWKEMGK
ncbi:DPP IV N-terminal domain-containing protein [Flammeovirgaceae bacterium SG7u.111]|nr:DPP IV N-terminal domain-containing protein [Flammeovirgaceae bacterium SG7u.132]WPO35143.1 DPP IV N-terminal domain-containing protein [Flammeovirgaceae bacterium SG7u.111]